MLRSRAGGMASVARRPGTGLAAPDHKPDRPTRTRTAHPASDSAIAADTTAASLDAAARAQCPTVAEAAWLSVTNRLW
jgi:hypothetical protein